MVAVDCFLLSFREVQSIFSSAMFTVKIRFTAGSSPSKELVRDINIGPTTLSSKPLLSQGFSGSTPAASHRKYFVSADIVSSFRVERVKETMAITPRTM